MRTGPFSFYIFYFHFKSENENRMNILSTRRLEMFHLSTGFSTSKALGHDFKATGEVNYLGGILVLAELLIELLLTSSVTGVPFIRSLLFCFHRSS